MMTLTAEQISSMIGQIYDCVLDPDRWQATIDHIRLELGAANCALACYTLPDGHMRLMITSGVERHWLERLPALMPANIESWGGQERIAQLPLAEPIIQTEAVGHDHYWSCRYIREWGMPQHLIDCIAVGLVREPNMVGHIAWGRHEDQGPIEPHELEPYRLLAPHFRRAVTISGLMDMQALARSSLERVLDALAPAVVVIDAELAIIYGNEAAREQLKQGQPIRSQNGRLALSPPAAQAALADAVSRAIGDGLSLGQRGIAIPLRMADGAAAVAHVMPLRQGKVRAQISERAVAAVFIAGASTVQHMPAAALALLYDLTPAESRVFDLIVGGQTQSEIAEALGIAPSTVKTHLLKVFQKTGTARQADLVRLASRLTLPL